MFMPPNVATRSCDSALLQQLRRTSMVTALNMPLLKSQSGRCPNNTCTTIKLTGECILVSLQLMFWIEAEVLAVVAKCHLDLRIVLSVDASVW